METQQDLFESAGITTTAGTAFFKPTGRAQRITVLRLRRPESHEATKKLPESHGGKTVNVLAVLDVELAGVPQRWEVTSARAIDALRAVVKSLPCDVLVHTRGEGKTLTYVVKVPEPEKKPAAGTPGKRCPAPACLGADGHEGRHFTTGGAPLSSNGQPSDQLV